MQCLYCKKRLGLFASKKFPYCSELHEVAYHDERSGLALRRVMDPLFTAAVRPPPLRVPSAQKPSAAHGVSVAVSLPPDSVEVEDPDPVECGVLAQRLPEPVPPELAAAEAPGSHSAPFDLPIEVEPFTAGLVQLPSTGEGVLAFDLDSSTLESEAEPEVESAAGIAAEEHEPSLSRRLFPLPESAKTAVGAEPGAPHPAAGMDPSPLSFGPAAAQTGLRMDEPAAGIAAEEREPILSQRLYPLPEPVRTTAGAEPGAPHPAGMGPSPLSFGPADAQTGPLMNAVLPGSANLALASPDSAIEPAAGIAEEREPMLSHRTLDPAAGMEPSPLSFEPAAVQTGPPMNARLAEQGNLSLAVHDSATGPAAEPATESGEHAPIVSHRLYPLLEQVRIAVGEEAGALRPAAGMDPTPLSFGPAAAQAGLLMNAGLPGKANLTSADLAGAAPLSLHATLWQHGGIPPAVDDAPGLTSLDWPLPLRYPLASIAIAREIFETPADLIASRWSTAGIAPPDYLAEPEPLGQQETQRRYPGGAQEIKFQVSQRALGIPEMAVLPQPPFAAANPLCLSPARLQEDTRTEPFGWPQAPPVWPSIIAAGSYRLEFSGTATVAMTLLPPALPGMLGQEPLSSTLACAPFRPDRLGLPSRTELMFALATPPGISSPRLQEDIRTEPFLWPDARPAAPGVVFARSFRVPFAGTAEAAMTLSAPALLRMPGQEPIASAFARARFRRERLRPPSRTELMFVLAAPPGISSQQLQEDLRTEPFRWPQARPELLWVASTNSFRIPLVSAAAAAMTLAPPARLRMPRQEPISFPFACAPFRRNPLEPPRPELPFLLADPTGISPAQLQEEIRREPLRRPQARPMLPWVASTSSFRIPFVGTAAAAALPVPASRVEDSVSPAMPRQEPILSSALAPARYGGDVLRSPARPELPLLFAEPAGISPERLQEELRPEPFRWPQALPALPWISSTSWFRIPLPGTAAAAATRPVPAGRMTGSVFPATPRQEPIRSTVASKAPVSAWAPLDPALGSAPAALEPRRNKPPRRAKLDPRERPAKLRNPNKGMGGGPRFPVEFHRPVSWSALDWARAASSHALVHPPPLEFGIEEIRQVDHPVRTIAMVPRAAERSLPLGRFAKFAPAVHESRPEEFRVPGVTDLQRFLAAAHIRIREPEMRHSTPGDFPMPSPGLPWSGVRMLSEIRSGAAPIPLRPALQNPSPR